MKKKRLSEQVIDEIERIISEEGFSDGDKFYSENVLTKKIEVSRTSVREALRILEISGRLKVHQGKGVFICNPLERGINEFANWLKSNKALLKEHFEVRLIIESKAAAYAASNIHDSEVDRLLDISDQFESIIKKDKLECLINLDRDFHQVLAESTRNRTYYTLMKAMTDSLQEGWVSSLSIPGRAEKTIAEHLRIYQAVSQHKPQEAEEAMASHLENALSDIMMYLENN